MGKSRCGERPGVFGCGGRPGNRKHPVLRTWAVVIVVGAGSMDRDGGKVMDVRESDRLVVSTSRCQFLATMGILPWRAVRMAQEALGGGFWPHVPDQTRWLADHTAGIDVSGVTQGMFRREAGAMADETCQLSPTAPLPDPHGRGRRLACALPSGYRIARAQPAGAVGKPGRCGAGLSRWRFPRRPCA